MPRGGARPGAGRPRKSLAAHALHGTRPARHGQLGTATAATVLTMPSAAQAGDWRPTESEIEPLSPLARKWLAAALSLYHLDPLEGERLLECLRVLSRIEVLESTSGMVAAGALVRERRLFQGMWAALGFGREA